TGVSSILASASPPSRITDPDAGALQGMAVVGVDNSHGTWQFSLDKGRTWNNFGTPTQTTARLLAADTQTRVRFLPTQGFIGDAAITFRAWDQTLGKNVETADASRNGGTSPFTRARGSARVHVFIAD